MAPLEKSLTNFKIKTKKKIRTLKKTGKDFINITKTV